MKIKKYVAYYRVSTREQEISGLGLDAQTETVEKTISEKGGSLIAEFIEAETGKKNDRKQLKEALALCKKMGATLVIAKLDRLSRSVSFIFQLKEAGVDFFACDLPACNTMNLAIFAAMAQHERELISERTKAALRAAKRRGVKLGCPIPPNNYTRRRSLEVRKEKSKMATIQSKNAIEMFLRDGFSLNEIARRLTKLEAPTPRGKTKWYASTVKAVMQLHNIPYPPTDDSDSHKQ